jgi:uncharacterized protein (UPF0332 family)
VSDTGVETFLAKAEESLATAESEFANRRFNSCANRCYYACFQAAVAALMRAGVGTPRADRRWSHDFVQAEFARLITRRKLYPASLQDTFLRLLTVRQGADYSLDYTGEDVAGRALRRTRHSVVAVRGGDQRR